MCKLREVERHCEEGAQEADGVSRGCRTPTWSVWPFLPQFVLGRDLRKLTCIRGDTIALTLQFIQLFKNRIIYHDRHTKSWQHPAVCADLLQLRASASMTGNAERP